MGAAWPSSCARTAPHTIRQGAATIDLQGEGHSGPPRCVTLCMSLPCALLRSTSHLALHVAVPVRRLPASTARYTYACYIDGNRNSVRSPMLAALSTIRCSVGRATRRTYHPPAAARTQLHARHARRCPPPPPHAQLHHRSFES